MQCPSCGGEVVKKTSGAGKGCLIFMVGLILVPILVGIPIILWGLFHKEIHFVCKNCGFVVGKGR